MAYGFVSILHLVALVFSIIELGLTAYCVSVFLNIYAGDGHHYERSPDVVNFMLFNSIWSLLVLAYVGITPLYYTRIFHRLASLALEAVTMIFWFAGSIALAVRIGGPYRCSDDDHLCGSLEAAIAFGFFLWALFVALVALDAIESMRSRRHVADTHHHHQAAKPAAYPGV